MKRLAALLCLFLFSAQTQFPLPATSSTQAEVNLGDIQLILDGDPGYQLDYPVQITPSAEDGVFMKGTIKNIDTSSGQTLLTIHVTRAQGGGIFSNWNLLVTSAPDVSVATGTAFSSTGNGAASLGMKMTLDNPGAFPYSAGTLAVGNTMSFTVPAGQNFPVDSHLKVDDYSNPNNHYHVRVKAYSGTTLTAAITGAFGSGAPSSAWRISSLVGPQTRIPFNSIQGLYIAQQGTTATVKISSGSVRDSQDQVDLVLSSPATIDLSSRTNLVQVPLTGTISNSGTTITGTGTSFISTLGFGTLGNSDFSGQFNSTIPGISPGCNSIISTGSASALVSAAVLSDTSLTTGDALSSSGSAYYRTGPVSTINTNTAGLNYLIIIAKRDSDGSVGAFAASCVPGNTTDLPTGYSTGRVIGLVSGVYYNGSNYTMALRSGGAPFNARIFQPMAQIALSNSAIAGSNGTSGALVYGSTGASGANSVLYGVTQITPALGGTGIDTSSSTGVPQVASGTWTVPAQVAASKGGTGADTSASTGVAQVVSGTWSVSTALASGTTATTQSAGDSSTKVATTAYVDRLTQKATNTLTGDVDLNNTANYFDGPSMAQGTTGTWFASGTVTVSVATAGDVIDCKLWDGTTIISSAQHKIGVIGSNAIALSGYLVSPATNIKISCRDETNTTGKIRFNQSGNSADSSIWGIRIN